MKVCTIKSMIRRINGSFFSTVLKRSLGMMTPFVLVGGISIALRDLPIVPYQELMTNGCLSWLHACLTAAYSGTFGLFSVAMVIALSFSYAMETNVNYDYVAMYVIVSLGAFGSLVNLGNQYFDMNSLGAVGCFPAVLVTYLSCVAYTKLRKTPWITLEEYTTGMGGICATAIQAFLPMVIIVGAVLLFNLFMGYVFGVHSLFEFITTYSCKVFDVVGTENKFLAGLLYTVLVQLFWFCGLHGSHVLEPVALNNFVFTADGGIFNKAFIDTYVVIGGSGATISLLIAALLFFNKDRVGKIAKIASFTVIFNSNEMLTLGIPIVFNPTLLIPFVLTPVVTLIISYAATAVGLVPQLIYENKWTTPVFLSGYLGTGSIKGAILQAVCIAVGVAIYYPFLKWNKRVESEIAKDQVRELVKELQEKEEQNEVPKLLSRGDSMGTVSRMLLRDLKYAIKNRDLFMLFQPQISADGKCIGAEALLRWNHPLHGFIYPPLIIYLAKEGNILPQLEELIIDDVARAIAEVEKEYQGDFKISFNITAQSLRWDIESCIEKACEKYHVDAGRMWIEITEQEMLSRTDPVIGKLERLKEKGHSLLIDDFGMGHTSILYLQSNFFSVVKLDGSLVKNVLGNDTNQKIIASVAELGQDLGVDIIAEFVENKEQQELLYNLGCKQYQGYMYSKPIPLNEFVTYIVKYNE